MLVPPRSKMLVSISRPSIPEDRDFFVDLDTHVKLTMFAHLVNSAFASVLVRNESDVSVQISRKFDLVSVIEVNYESCFQIDLSDLVIKASKESYSLSIALLAVRKSLPGLMKAKLANGVMVFGDAHAMKALTDLVNEFPGPWVDKGFVNVP